MSPDVSGGVSFRILPGWAFVGSAPGAVVLGSVGYGQRVFPVLGRCGASQQVPFAFLSGFLGSLLAGSVPFSFHIFAILVDSGPSWCGMNE